MHQLFTIIQNENTRSFEEMETMIEGYEQNLPQRIGIDFDRNAREIAMQIEFVMLYYPDINYNIIHDCIEQRVLRTNNLLRIQELRNALEMATRHLFINIAEDIQENEMRVWQIIPVIVLENEEEIEEKECPICMNEFQKKDMVFTGCNHYYCSSCMNELIEKTTTNSKPPGCALCRTVIDTLHVKQENFITFEQYI